ncbi:DNA repair helicase [Ascobolus immersus RN42]|uniref:ATP-dependent DNA helicase CHL1 n=1 Tax=Ascobolus immersus RN42 TaxID=1160509 RepID=A0A3N4HFX8_ASCIM|nr:DNA repair helicase [Ascobolus immersus RN42]
MAQKEQKDFHHPYKPYDIQVQFMTELYNTIEDGKIGIFESPTGTGKSLSLICGALTWLRENKAKQLNEELNDDEIDPDEPEWVRQFAREDKKKKLLAERIEMEKRLEKIREKERRDKERAERAHDFPRKRQKTGASTDLDDDEEQFMLDDYESDEEGSKTRKRPRAGDMYEGLSETTLDLLRKTGVILSPDDDAKEDDLPDGTKIYYCSRTHSQLSQFVNELRRVKVPTGIPDDTDTLLAEEVKHLSLGSRKNLCINPAVNKLASTTSMNEKCLELQQSGTSAEKRCQFLPTKDEQHLYNDFRDHALATIKDIEDLAELGKSMKVCPYYASRQTIRPTEVITLPYQLLLQKSAREALGISLKNNVVIIDEAHNLMDTISALYSTTITLSQVQRAELQLKGYLHKFGKRLKGKNRVYIAQILKLLIGLREFLEKEKTTNPKSTTDTRIVPPTDITSYKGIDQVNLFKLLTYIHESKLARKIEGYISLKKAQKAAELQKSNTSRPPNTGKPGLEVPVLTHLTSFLLALTNPSSEGRIFCGAITDDAEIGFKYMLLDPAHHFHSIVSSARSVILAGGTMSPMEDYTTYLFPTLPPSKITTLSCGHVIPSTSLLARTLTTGPTSIPLEFTFEKRNDPAMITELGRGIFNLTAIIPGGIVVFFPSYSYLAQVLSVWEKPGADGSSLWTKLQKRKDLYTESAGSSSIEETLSAYTNSITSGRGAVLFSVVNGKMSEGINFNDDLGRCVVMVGLPFPNLHTAEWKAKLAHIEATARAQVLGAKKASSEFYENACMRAVNQSIGRAIRHRGDYACIVLADRRYNGARIRAKLPGWIREGVVTGEGKGEFAGLMGAASRFFAEKKKATAAGLI